MVKKNPPTRLSPNLVPRERRWMVDADYVDSLSPEDAKYLAQFLDEYYRADYRYAEPMHDTAELRSERYGMQNANHRDTYSLKQASGELVYGIPVDRRTADTLDLMPSPRYLNSEEYKTVVAEMRKLADVRESERSPRQRARIETLQMYLLSIREADEDGEG